MAEARVEDEEESLRETREAGGPRRNPRPHSAASGRADRNKPEQRQSSSQGALSSIRAVIKRTSTRATAPTNPVRERRRPEITILAAEPLATSSWGVFPPPPPPAQPSWTASVTVELPPPSYDQVIREKSREQNIFASSVSSSSSSSSPSSSLSSSSSSSSAAAPRHTATISTQTEPEVPESPSCTRPLMRRPPKPPRPSLPPAPKPAEPVLAHMHSLIELDEPDPCCSTHTPAHPPSGEQCDVQTDVTPTLEPLIPISHDSSHITQNSQSQDPLKQEGSKRPRPRPRSKASLQAVISEESQDQPITREVKVQTLVRLKDDSGESVFAGFTDPSLDTASNKYLQDLLEVFGCGVPDIQSHQHDESDHSTKSDEEEALESCSVSTVAAEPWETRPEPRPRTQKPKPPVAAKPSDLTQSVEKTKPPADEQNQPVSHPVPAPRPLVKKSPMFQRQGSSEEKTDPCCPQRPPLRPLLAALKSGASTWEDGAGVRFNPSERSNSGDQHQTAAAFGKPVAMTSSGRGGQCPAKPPSHRRPPPSTHTPAQDAVSSVGVTKSGPSLPHRAGEARMLPLRPPPIKTSKPPGSSQTPAATNQHPGGSRGAKRGPPLPPRPKPGHALFRECTTKSPGGDPEESHLQKQKLLVAPDEPPGDVKGRRRASASEDPVSQKRPELKIEPRTEERRSETTTGVRYRAQLAFSGEDGELTFSDGDVIKLIGYVNEEWGRGRLNGTTGNFPLNFVQLVQESPATNLTAESSGDGQTGRVLYDFTPESEDELCLKVGDLVSSLEEVDEEWFVGEFAGRRGIVPKNHIHVL